MRARLPLVIIGSVLMIVSLFLPMLLWYAHMNAFGMEVDGAIYYWIYGFFYAIVKIETGYSDIEITSSYVGIEFDPFGLICMMIIITGVIVSLILGIATEEKVAVIGGVIGLTGIILYYVGVLMALPITPTHEIVEAGYYPIPFIGFFICLIGGIVALVGGLLEKDIT